LYIANFIRIRQLEILKYELIRNPDSIIYEKDKNFRIAKAPLLMIHTMQMVQSTRYNQMYSFSYGEKKATK